MFGIFVFERDSKDSSSLKQLLNNWTNQIIDESFQLNLQSLMAKGHFFFLRQGLEQRDVVTSALTLIIH